VVVVGASLLVAWGLRRALRTNARFAIRVVHVDGNERRSAQEIAKRAGAEVGKNIFELDPERAGDGIEADPWIERATVRRDLPSAIRIEVVEREARALAVLDRRLYLVDSKGRIFKELGRSDPHDLPVVTGIDPEAIRQDREGVVLRLRRVLDLLADLERVGIARRFPIQEIHLRADSSLVVTVGTDAIALHLGRPPYRHKVEQADRVLLEVTRRKAKPTVVFLDDEAHPERVVVRMK